MSLKPKVISYKILDSDTSSPSIQIKINYSNGEKSFLKVWPSRLCPDVTQNLNYESKVYEQIKRDILKSTENAGFVVLKGFNVDVDLENLIEFITPDYVYENKGFYQNKLISCYDEDGMPSECSNIEELKEELRQILRRNLINICKTRMPFTLLKKEYINNLKIGYIETVSIENSFNLQDFLETEYIDIDVKYRVILETLKYLKVLNEEGIFHNDLHNGNILIDIERDYYGNIIKYKPKIYDFDLSYSLALGPNKGLDLYPQRCIDYGYCNDIKIDSKKDFLKFLCGFYKFGAVPDEIFANIVFTDEILEVNPKLVKDIMSTISKNFCFISKEVYDLDIYRDRESMIKYFEDFVLNRVLIMNEYINKENLGTVPYSREEMVVEGTVPYSREEMMVETVPYSREEMVVEGTVPYSREEMKVETVPYSREEMAVETVS